MIYNAGNKTAVSCGDTKISYNDLKVKIATFAQLLKDIPLNRVAVFSENQVGWIYSFYAGWYNNATIVPIDFMSSEDEVAYILKDCFPEVVFTSIDKKAHLEKAIEKAGITTRIFVIEECNDLPLADVNSLGIIDTSDDKTAVIIYTSGTTGSPKGVMLSYTNLMANVDAVSNQINIYTKDEVVMMLLPMHHIFPLMGTMIAPLFVGGTIAVSPSMASEDIMKTLQDNKVSIIIGVPRLYSAIRKGIRTKIDSSPIARVLFSLAKSLNSKSFSRKVFKSAHQKFGGAVKFMVSGGAALDPEVGDDFKTLGFEVLEGFGMTEAAPMITFTRPGRVRIGSPGEALPGAQIEIRDGEVVVKGPNVMQGYFNRPEETAEVLKDGWLYTGDLGRMDEEGYLYITGRKKEIIVLSNGKNINPSEVETKIENMAACVAEIGVYADLDQLKAIIVPNRADLKGLSNEQVEDKLKWEVIDAYNKSVSPYKKIMDFSVSDDDLPRTRLGKLQRFKLAELAKVDKEVEPAIIEKITLEEYKVLVDFISSEKNCNVRPGDHIEYDLALDSLDKVGLLVFIQSTFGIEMEVEQLVSFGSVLELSEYIAEKRTKLAVEKINWSKILKEKVHLQLPRTWFTGALFLKASKYFFHLYFRFRGKGTANIPEGPCIIAPNHQSYFDGLFVASWLKNKSIRNTYFYAKEKHIKSRFLKFFANRHHIIIMDLNKDLKESIQKMGEALKKKKNLIIFPEGTRSFDGSLGEFKKTFAILSRELNVPIVPVSIKGAVNALPRGSKFPRPFKKVSVEFLKPVYPSDESYERLSELVYNSISVNQQLANG
ncbi:AMP-binding protein [Carboxylicivirga mesophila]|uniref:AMP-binding protein n=1 Tax=Carboxylicivirga mesophila TaxID=1166478 RepID=A0ABS5K9L3_9BACT|nr:AMP-binding protein [Carboxylicivirga mesophila]MBS2211661.1 AMP-binding protein [Carboxylicivirga mesophila]